MDEFFRAANQFGLSIALMLTMIVALATWIVKKTVPKELHDFQREKLSKELDEITNDMEQLIKITDNNVRTLESVSNALSAQNHSLADISKQLEIMRYAQQEKDRKK